MSVRKLGGRVAAAIGFDYRSPSSAASPHLPPRARAGRTSRNGDASVGRERAAIKWDGTTQDLVVSLDVLGATPDAGFLMPRAGAGRDHARGRRARSTSSPSGPSAREEKVTNWWPNLTFLDKLGFGMTADDDTAGWTAAIEVLEQRQLGRSRSRSSPTNDPAALPAWLTANGYQVDEAVGAARPRTPRPDGSWSR